MSDTMLLGVLRMPMDNPDPLTLSQFVDRARQAADRIETLATALSIAREYPDFDDGGPLADMIDAVLAGEPSTMLETIAMIEAQTEPGRAG